MNKTLAVLTFVFILCPAPAAETHTLTLKQAAARALNESPEALLARLDEQKAARDVEVARDPFHPKFYAGSGLAYSYGFPMSIEGSAPSIVQAKGIASLYNRRQRLQLEQAKEGARGAALDAARRREEALFQAVDLFLDAERRGRLAELAGRQIDSARKLDQIVTARVAEGRELPVEARRTALDLAKAEQRVASLAGERDYAEGLLALVLGYAPGDRVRPAVDEERTGTGAAAVPESEAEALRLAAAENREIRRLESALAAKGLAAQSERAARYPQLDLVAQYGLFARFNNYEDFFRRFQRHNGQIGMSVQVPLWLGPAAKALAAKADAEGAQLRIELAQARGRVALETQRRYRDYQTAGAARQVARLDLDVAREQLTVELARHEEGRSTLRRVEELRLAEQEKWMAYYGSQSAWERARYALLERTGGLVAALR